MTYMRLSSGVVRACIERLDQDLPAVIAEINADVPDGEEIEAPKAIFPIVPSPGLLVDYPAVGFRWMPSRLEDDTGGSATGVHELACVYFLVNPDLELLGWQLAHYASALTTVLLRDRRIGSGAANGDGAWGVTFVNWLPGPTLGDADDPEQVKTYLSYGAIVLRFKREEL